MITAFKAVTNVADQDGVEAIAQNLADNLNQIGSDLSAASSTLSSFSGMTTSAQQLLDTTGSFLKETQEHSKNTTDSLKKVKKSFSGIDETVSGATDGVNAAINSGKEFYDQMSEIIDSAFSSNSQSADDVAGTLNALASRVQKVIDSYTSLKSAIDEINVGNNAQLNALKGSISGKLGETIATQTELRDKLKSTASSLQ